MIMKKPESYCGTKEKEKKAVEVGNRQEMRVVSNM